MVLTKLIKYIMYTPLYIYGTHKMSCSLRYQYRIYRTVTRDFVILYTVEYKGKLNILFTGGYYTLECIHLLYISTCVIYVCVRKHTHNILLNFNTVTYITLCITLLTSLTTFTLGGC